MFGKGWKPFDLSSSASWNEVCIQSGAADFCDSTEALETKRDVVSIWMSWLSGDKPRSTSRHASPPWSRLSSENSSSASLWENAAGNWGKERKQHKRVCKCCQGQCFEIHSLGRNGSTRLKYTLIVGAERSEPGMLQWNTELLQSRAGKCMSGVCWMRGC